MEEYGKFTRFRGEMWGLNPHLLNKLNKSNMLMYSTGGEGGIRTPDTVTRMPHFECGAFNHSATSPQILRGVWSWCAF
jgi:hypothetical protein